MYRMQLNLKIPVFTEGIIEIRIRFGFYQKLFQRETTISANMLLVFYAASLLLANRTFLRVSIVKKTC